MTYDKVVCEKNDATLHCRRLIPTLLIKIRRSVWGGFSRYSGGDVHGAAIGRRLGGRGICPGGEVAAGGFAVGGGGVSSGPPDGDRIRGGGVLPVAHARGNRTLGEGHQPRDRLSISRDAGVA